jgi:Spy/CpxP family protein refolding chaperone
VEAAQGGRWGRSGAGALAPPVSVTVALRAAKLGFALAVACPRRGLVEATVTKGATMLSTMTKMVMTAVFGLTMFTAGDASAGGHRGDRGAKMCEHLECTAAQQAQLAQIREAHKPAMQASREAIRDLKQQLVAEYQKERVDTAKVAALRQQIDAHKATAEREREAMKAKIEAILTPAQRAKLAEFKAQHKGPKGKGHHRGLGRGPGPGKTRGV